MKAANVATESGLGAALPKSPVDKPYALPSHLAERLDEISWETIMEMSGSFAARHGSKRPEVAHLHKQISMARILLMEKAREQSGRQALDPGVLVDLVRLLQRCEKLSADYEMDLGEFNHFLYLLISKVKKEKLARHEGMGGWKMRRFEPMDVNELEGFKKKSERRRHSD